eukprot:3833355-Pleurochrysis_carterae.AAC.2
MSVPFGASSAYSRIVSRRLLRRSVRSPSISRRAPPRRSTPRSPKAATRKRGQRYAAGAEGRGGVAEWRA